MSKRDITDKRTYTFMKLGMHWFSHGKITLDNKSSYVDGKQVECPECKHKFVWDKFYRLSPRYARSWYDSPANVDKIPYGFAVEMEIQTPSVDCKGRGDRLPRIAYIMKSCKLTIEDRVNDSSPLDAVALFSEDSQLELKILEME